MEIHLIIGHRKENYSGEFAPEVLEAMDDIARSDNPEWIEEKFGEYQKTNEFDALKVMTIHVPDSEIDKRLYPNDMPIKGTII